MSNASDFVIENGVLKKYVGPGGDVVVPEGVTEIGEWAFSRIDTLTSILIPDHITSIGKWAFFHCPSLADVTLSKNLAKIGGSAFEGCGKLQSVDLPDSIQNIGDGAFRETGFYQSEANWVDGALYLGHTLIRAKDTLVGEYSVRNGTICIADGAFRGCGNLSCVVLPDGLISIGKEALCACRSLSSISIPDSVSFLGPSTFHGCTNLTNITMPKGIKDFADGILSESNIKTIRFPETLISVERSAFYGCNIEEIMLPYSAINGEMFGQSGKTIILTVTRPDKAPARVVASFRKEYWSQTWNYPLDYLLPLSEDAIPVYDKLVAGGSYDGFSMNENGRIRAALWRLADTEYPVANELRGAFADFLGSKLSKAIKFAEEDKAPKYIRTLVNIGAINADNQKKASKALAKSEVPEIRAMADQLTVSAEPAQPAQQEADGIDPRFTARIKKINAIGVLTRSGIETLPSVKQKDGADAPADYLRLILAEYCRQVRTEDCLPVPLADEAAELLDRASLNAALRTVYDSVTNEKQQLAALLPLFRYAEGSVIRELYPKNRYIKWKEPTANRALLLSDTREAMLYADKQGLLERYADVRGTDADTLRDTVLAEFGLDANGRKNYDLGAGTVTVSLGADLTLDLFDESAGKAVKSIPKKNADPEKYEAAKADFAELKKNVKQVAKNRSDRLFQAFLTGREFKAADWKAVYLQNPVLNAVGRLIVWAQGEKTFTLTASGPANSGLQACNVTDEPIRVAHPMEMSAAETSAWQKYFTAQSLKQPFQQVWEPMHMPEEIKPDRYAGCMIPYYRFNGQVKHGISVYDFDFHDNIDITLNGCSAEIERIDWQRHEINMDDRFEIKQFGFANYTRQVNHVVAYLDRVTVWDRVRKDDMTVMDLMPGFTLAQITEFITAAQEANATNVLAALLEYKNANFADFDPMDEFTLEW